MKQIRTVGVGLALVLLIAACAGDDKVFHTTAGEMSKDDVNNVLAHQHVFVEFGVDVPTAYVDSTPEEVYDVIGPLIDNVKDRGYGVFVDSTPEGVGFRPDIVKYVADTSGLPAMMVTGLYYDKYIPDWARNGTVDDIANWMIGQLNVGIGDTGVKAGWIKLSQGGDDTGPITEAEMKVLEAACEAQKETGAFVGSHILTSKTALAAQEAFTRFGCKADRFMWIHAPYTAFAEENGIDKLVEFADNGGWISHDFIGSQFWAAWLDGENPDERQIEWLNALIDAGHEDRLIIGTDTGWYDPGFPEGFVVEPYDQIVESFVPSMEAAGYSAELINKLMHENPWNAYSR